MPDEMHRKVAQKLGSFAESAQRVIREAFNKPDQISAPALQQDGRLPQLEKLIPQLNYADVIDKVLIPHDNTLGNDLKKAYLASSGYWTQFKQHGGNWMTLRNHLGSFVAETKKWG